LGIFEELAMAANQLITMVLRLFLRKAVSKGLDAGMRKMSGPSSGAASKGTVPQASRTLHQAMKVTRRITRL
jgi:hypothetical protein